MKTIRKNIVSDLTGKEAENIPQLKVSDVSDFQLENGFNELTKRGFYFRRPRVSFWLNYIKGSLNIGVAFLLLKLYGLSAEITYISAYIWYSSVIMLAMITYALLER